MESFRVVSESFSPTNSVINPPETNGFLIGARFGAVVATGGGSCFSPSGSIVNGTVVATVDAGEATIVCADGVTGVCAGRLDLTGDMGSTRGEGARARREAAPVINPGISSDEAEDAEDGDDWRSMSTVSEDTGLIRDVLLAASSKWVHGASGSTGARCTEEAVDEGLPSVVVAGVVGVTGTSIGDGVRR